MDHRLEREDLDRLPDWLDPVDRAALGAPDGDPALAALAVGRLLRAGSLEAGLAGTLEAFLGTLDDDTLADSLKRSALESLGELAAELPEDEAEVPGGARLARWLLRRDDAESAAWVLGLWKRADAERAVLDAARDIDRRASARSDDIAGTAARSRDLGLPEWLRVVARASEPAWWVDAVTAAAHHGALDRWFSRPLVAVGARVLELAREVASTSAAFQYDDGELDRILERPLGPPVARLFDGVVEVHAHGMADHDADVPPGLFVRHAGGDLDRIEAVALEPAGPAQPQRSDVALGWWVPLGGSGGVQRELVVRYRGEDEVQTERLRIDPPPADE